VVVSGAPNKPEPPGGVTLTVPGLTGQPAAGNAAGAPLLLRALDRVLTRDRAMRALAAEADRAGFDVIVRLMPREKA